MTAVAYWFLAAAVMINWLLAYRYLARAIRAEAKVIDLAAENDRLRRELDAAAVAHSAVWRQWRDPLSLTN